VTDSAALQEHLVAHQIAGDVATSREDNLRKYTMFADRAPGAMFGLEPRGGWDFADILDLMARRVGVSPDPSYRRGPDRIDAALTVAGLDRMAERLAAAASAPGARVIVATGHPAGLLPVHLAVVTALRNRGVRILTPASGWSYQAGPGTGSSHREIRYVDDVAMVSNRGELNHTHSPRPMEAMLRSLAEDGELPPDLVVGDHGWVGAAGQAGVTAVGFADSNDPGLFVGEEEGTVAVAVPLDDNVAPHLYAPVTTYLLSAAGLSPGR
jgi:hypothetical protein